MRVLTVTVSESSWTTYEVPVPNDFDESDGGALEEYMYFGDKGVDRFPVADGAVEARDLTVDADNRQ